jgi:metal-sulfur cluster biosynthetic enzyme
MSPPLNTETSLKQTIWSRLEAIVDPCSRASGAPAGLVSMGLVGGVTIQENPDGACVHVTLYITEPGCMMGALFQLTAERALAELPGVTAVQVAVDYSHVWSPEQMTPEYRQRLTEVRERRRKKLEESEWLRPAER